MMGSGRFFDFHISSKFLLFFPTKCDDTIDRMPVLMANIKWKIPKRFSCKPCIPRRIVSIQFIPHFIQLNQLRIDLA